MKKTTKWLTAGVTAIAIGWTPGAIAQTAPGTTPPFVPNQTGQVGPIVATPQQIQQQQNALQQGQPQNILQQGEKSVQGIIDFVTNIPDMLQGAIGSFKAPDLGKLAQTFLGGSSSQTQGGQIAELIENQTPGKGSFSIRNDQANESFRTTGMSTTQQSTLSDQAQARAKQVLQATDQATTGNTNLGNESQNLDVSQQILQNISQQMALNGQVNKVLADEAQQGRVDRAIGNVLTAQTAEEAQIANIANRRETSGAANSAVVQAGSVMLFGGGAMGQPKK